ncbi:RNA polymerase III-inhibiting protein maf1 [Scheffersomyces spartinae]|uniref:Repressor of RNA polymerase III transcription MAF1 n=1 Tax=Scheffersomyces spartinae TaxID=45513 RepID=A0A9P7V7S8_9ASCO|nr:RNA polymerase III-inhibiting protein maf1 [Scheffersomyces spartinae]KAG7192955.1 RNA polymerase III-inhibiting protein maf1 [Scheffersomyces spartinae]
MKFLDEVGIDNVLITFKRGSVSSATTTSALTETIAPQENNDIQLEQSDNLEPGLNESPFGPLENVTTRKTFAYLIAILNSCYPDHDFSNLQPTTENFHRINHYEELMTRFNNLMMSLGKDATILNWIWDTINLYMNFLPSTNSPLLGPAKSSRQNSISTSPGNRDNNAHFYGSHTGIPNHSHSAMYEQCQIFEFQPSDQTIFEDLNYPYQTMWSYYWFIYNKKKKRVAFLYLNGINKIHYNMINGGRRLSFSNNSRRKNKSELIGSDEEFDDDEELFMDEYSDDAMIDDDDGDDGVDDVVGDIEI